jgi:hypothetical protein
MLDFSQVRNKKMTYKQLVVGLTQADLRHLTNEMIDEQLRLISGCDDRDVVFVPQDPQANDPYAGTEAEVNLAWTLGHVIVHVTASSEESTFLAAELARGVPHREGRSRFEVPWDTVTTILACRQRLEESRRVRIASLDVWPDEPHLDNVYTSRYASYINPVVRFVFGLMHDDSHLDQITEIVRQALVARSGGN